MSLHAVSTCPAPRVVIAHDYLTQRGGAERTVLGLARTFPGARIVTSFYQPDVTFSAFRGLPVEVAPLNAVRAFRADPRKALPLLPRLWERTRIDDADVVICSSSGWAHAVRTDAPKIVYCHNPARWVHQSEDYFAGSSVAARLTGRLMRDRLLAWDRRHAASADRYVANSTATAGRILAAYGREATVVPPPVLLDPHAAAEEVQGVRPGFLLTIARGRRYKNVDLVCEAVAGIPGQRLVVVGGTPSTSRGRPWGDRVTELGTVSDRQLIWLYRNCSAVVSASREDFGLTPVEGYLFGKPAVLLRRGGFLDTLVDGVTGRFIEAETSEAVRAAILNLPPTDPHVLHTFGKSFQVDAFARRMTAVVDEVLAAPRPASASTSAPGVVPAARPAPPRPARTPVDELIRAARVAGEPPVASWYR